MGFRGYIMFYFSYHECLKMYHVPTKSTVQLLDQVGFSIEPLQSLALPYLPSPNSQRPMSYYIR